jgi:class 3 adenylate cyclase/tetratricopeptide (TPR) repeat protein
MTAVRQWLESLGLGQYAEPFEIEEIEIADLRDLTEADLERLGLPMGPRKRLLRAIHATTAEPGGQTEARPNPKYAPAPLAAKILEARASIEGERKQVTILFADVKGSTNLVQHMDAEAVSNLLDPVQRMMMDAVHAYEGTVNEVSGDGIMAIFGAPIAHEDHALRACRAALDMQHAVRRSTEQAAPGSVGQAIRLRVGLNSGEVVVRAINNDLTITYSAMGMTTHLAARMEQSAAPGSIRLTNDTLRHVGGLIDVRPRGEIKVKGVTQPVLVYELRGRGKAQTRLEAATLAGLTRFVGREQEMRAVEERFAEADAGQGQVVSIVGDPGIGKSRVLMEFRERIGERASWVEGRCVSFGQSMAFHPVIDLMRRNFRIEEQDPAEVVREKVTAGVARIGPGFESRLPYVFYMLGVAEPGDPVQRVDPQIRRAETFDALRQLLLRAAERKPQVMVYEDLHWSDNATREFLRFLLDSIPRSRVLILLTLRPGHDLALADRTYATRLVLRNLSTEESAEMTAALLASADLPPELHALVQRKAEGNPFFVEELIKSLSETGAIHRDGTRWMLGRPLDQIVVPNTIQDVLMARIDHLEEEPRQTLQLAAVIGREFTQRLLDRIAEIRRGTTAVLRELQAIELIHEKALFPELAYMFKHALTQDVAYGSLLTPRRRELHRRIGEAIEELYADRLAEHYTVLAYHFGRGEDWARAADYFEQAAEQAAAAFAIQEAIALSDQALAALDHRGDDAGVTAKQADLHARKAGLLMLLSDFNRAHGEHERAADMARQLHDGIREGTAFAEMALASVYAHSFDRGVQEAQKAMAVGRAIGSNEVIAAGQFSVSFIAALTGALDDGAKGFNVACRLTSHTRSSFYHIASRAMLCEIDNWRGNYSKAITRGKEARLQGQESNLVFAHLFILFSLGLPLTGIGKCDEALSVFSEGLQLAEKVGDEIWRNRLLNCMGWVHAECGGLERAIEFNERGVGVSRERGDPEVIANCELNLGDAARARNDLPLAREYFESVRGLADRRSTSDWMKWRYSQHLFAGMGETWLALDEPTKAGDFCDQCLDLAARTDSRKYLARGWRLRGEIAKARLDWEEAEQALRKALTLAKRVGNPTQLWQTQLALGQLHRDTCRVDAASVSFAAAQKVIDDIGRSLHTPELKEGFDGSPTFRAVSEQIEANQAQNPAPRRA